MTRHIKKQSAKNNSNPFNEEQLGKLFRSTSTAAG
jgi:hypothetical protein